MAWAMTAHFRAAHNALLAAQTGALMPQEIVSAATACSRKYLVVLQQNPDLLSPVMSMCFLARAFAEAGIYAAAARPDGSVQRLCWYRIKDIPAACGCITEDDINSVRRALLSSPGVVV